MESATFTPEQIEDAIRYGMRGDRMRYEIEATEAAQKGVTYESDLDHYRNLSQKCLNQGDYRQAAEKSWGHMPNYQVDLRRIQDRGFHSQQLDQRGAAVKRAGQRCRCRHR